MANTGRIDLTGDDDDAGLHPQPTQPLQQQQQEHVGCEAAQEARIAPAVGETNVVAIHCGEKGLAVCGVRADLRVKRPSRRYVITGFEHITDMSYRGTHKLPALAGMVQRLQVLDSVFAADPHSFVVLMRAKAIPGADSMTLDAVRRREAESARISSTVRQRYPHAQILDIVSSSTNTAVSTFLQQHPKKQAQAAVAAGSASALEAARTFGTPEYSKAKRRTQAELVEAAKTFLNSSRVSMEDTVSNPVDALEVYNKPVDAARAVATAFWMCMYSLDQKPASLVLKSSTNIQQQQQQPAGALAPVAGAAAGGSSPAAAAGGPAAQLASFIASLTPAQLASAQAALSGALGGGATAAGMQQQPPGAAAAAGGGGAAAGGAGAAPGRLLEGSPGNGATPSRQRHGQNTQAAAAGAAGGAHPDGLAPQTQPQQHEPPQHRHKRRRRGPAPVPLPFVFVSLLDDDDQTEAAPSGAIVISDSE